MKRIIPLLAAVALLGGCASSPSGGAAKDDPIMAEVVARDQNQSSGGAAKDDPIKDLMNAVASANFKTVRGLISSGVDANACWTNTRVTALMEAARRGYKFILIELINAGASINAQDVNGTTALMFAAQGGYSECVRLLLAAGADPDIQRQGGMTALMFATQNGHMELAKLLLEAGADPDIQNEDGWTAFSVEMLESKERARMAADGADWARRIAEEEERAALADRIIAKKYGSLFSSYSDYEAWKKRCNSTKFTYSLISPIYSGVEYGEGDMFIVEKYKLEIKDMQFAGGGFAYLVGGLGHIGGYSQLCYLISVTQIPYLTAQGRSMITKPLLLEYIGQDQYMEGYKARTCDVFLAFAEGSSEYEDFQNMLEDVQKIVQNPSEYAYILDE